MKIAKKLTEKYGYGPNCYTVSHEHFNEVMKWLHENSISYWHVSSGPEGYGFQVTSNVEWFNLKWL